MTADGYKRNGMTVKSERLFDLWNGSVIHTVPVGFVLRDPAGQQSPITIDDNTVGFAGRALYCTKAVLAKLEARIGS